jgi:prepilin-type N-terminal cleavage/methylation domain-containing protein
MKKLQHGFSAVEVVIAIFVVAAIGATGYLAFGRMKDASKAPSASEQVQEGTTPAAPAVDDQSDLDAAAKTLDETNLEASTADSAALDTELSSF